MRDYSCIGWGNEDIVERGVGVCERTSIRDDMISGDLCRRSAVVRAE